MIMVSGNVLFKIDTYWGDGSIVGNQRLVGYLDACIAFGFLTADEGREIHAKLMKGERVYKG